MKKLTEKQLESISIEATEDGFTVWHKEPNGRKHWLLDGSMLKEDGQIRLGRTDLYSVNACYNKKDRLIEIKKK